MITSNFGVVQFAHNVNTVTNVKALLHLITALCSLLWLQNTNHL